MDPQTQFGFKEILTHIVGDVARAVCERPNESKSHQFMRTQAAIHMVLDLQPRDVIEAMLSGHTMMFHALMTDSVHDTLQGQVDTMRRPTRANIVAMDKAFHMNLRQLAHYQARPSQGSRDGLETAPKQQAEVVEADRTPAPTQPETSNGGPDAAQVSASQPVRGQDQAPNSAPQAAPRPAAYRPSPEAIAACKANPEAMAALKAGDAAGFARAMGVQKPSDAYLATAEGRLGEVDWVAAAVPGTV